MSAARAIVEGDGEVPEVEQALLEALALECELDSMPDLRPLDEVVNELGSALAEDVTQRNAFVLELAGVAAIDGEFHQAEVDALRTLAEAAGISERKLDSFLDFGLRARQLVADGQQLIAASDRGE